MKLKAIAGLVLTPLFIGMLTLAFNVQPVKAEPGTIYIRADGTIDPPTAPISSVGNITYTFTGNINDSIVVERDNIVVDGANYTVQGKGSGKGIDLSFRYNVTLKNVEVTNFDYGIYLYTSSNNVLTGNNASNNQYGIYLYSSSNDNILSGNTASNNDYGIDLYACGNNVLSGNTASNNDYGIRIYFSSNDNVLYGNTASSNNQYGIYLYTSSNNTLFHNNLINNDLQAYVTTGYVNTWDDGYPSGGNHWSDYTDVDQYSGPYQNITGSDGIGDTPYIIAGGNKDNYPFMNPWGWEVEPPSIGTVSQEPEVPDDNESVTVTVVVTDEESGVHDVTLSYSTDDGETWNNVTMEKTIGDTYQGEIPGLPAETRVQYKIIAYDNVGNPSVEDNTGEYYIYTVIPEFPTWTSMLLILIVLTFAIAINKRRILKTTIH